MKVLKKIGKNFKKILIIGLLLTAFLHIQKTNWQYYYYDSSTSSFPYQQWCNETLNVRVNTQWDWIRAGRFHLILDPSKIFYSTSADPITLRSNLFNASSQTFGSRSSESSPSWWDWLKTILQIDRSNSTTNYNWTNWLYWTIQFTPLYNTIAYDVSFGTEYIPWSSTDETTLSLPWWVEAINSSQQLSNITGTYNILQQPCIADTNRPNIITNTPINWWDKQSKLSWIQLNLNEAIWVNWISNVPYIWTGWIWTGNIWWSIANQYGINLNSFTLNINWNWQTKIFTWSSLWVSYTWSDTTRQWLSKNYSINISPDQIPDYGIEKMIVITTNVSDRIWNIANTNTTIFNLPEWPKLLWNPIPYNWDIFVNLSAPIQLSIQDNRAWVNSWSISITLSWINWTQYWPYIFSGVDLNLSWLQSNANQPNYHININDHPDFPASWNIKVTVYAQDMEGNIDEISDYSFSTRPSCGELQCCDVTIITPTQQLRYNQYNIYISWRHYPTFYTWSDWSGYINCNTQDVWLKIYNWDWSNTSSANILSPYYDWIDLILSWRNWIKATLSGDTIYLSIISLFWYDMTGAILFTWSELSDPTIVWDKDLDITIEASFSSWIVIQSTWDIQATEVIEAYIPPQTQIIQTWSTCNPTVIQKPIFTWKQSAESVLSNYDIYTAFKIWFICPWSQIKFYNNSGEAQEVEIRIKTNTLTQSWILKVWYSNDLINRNALWTANVVDQIASFSTTHFTYFALWYDKPIWEQDTSTPWWGGWWVKLIKDDCPDWDFSDSYYDNDCGSPDSHFITDYCGVGETKYNQEQVDAFQYAYWFGITTMCPIEDARLDWYILRKELAKMISEFAIKIVWIYPNFSKNECGFYDDLRKESDEMQFYIKLSCKLWLMWLHTDWITPKDNFDPNDYVTRSQFGTIMSRLIFGWKYNWNTDNWYIDHLNALKLHDIMNYIDNPQMKELRWYVMIMMQRADESWTIRQMRAVSDFINWANNLFNTNIYQDATQQ